MATIEDLEKEIEIIKNRNKRVEADKAWETSWTRRITVAISTYIIISILLMTIKVDRPFLNAIIPAVAYLLSTSSLEIMKNIWLSKRK